MKKKCRIEVIKCLCNEDVAKEYGKKGINYCGIQKVGDVFYSDGTKPDKLCGDAWTCMVWYVSKLVENDVSFYNGDWVNKENMAIVSCNDGLNPVVYKLERTNEDC